VTRSRTARARGPGSGRAAIGGALAALVWLGGACTDPRPRPTPPTIRITLSATIRPTSPGTLAGSVYLFDANGLASVEMKVDLSNGSVLGDSAVVLSDPFETTESFEWRLVGGIPSGTGIRVVVRAVSYIGFESADTVATAVEAGTGTRR
jgi:hypothetical protein